MVKINLICVGKIKEKYLIQGIDEYLKRLSRFANINIIELDDLKEPKNISKTQIEQIKLSETKNIISHIPKNSYVICLTPHAKELTSVQFSNTLKNIEQINSNITFVIGGSYGIDEKLLNANLNISFSSLTFPHQLFRLIFFEQLYRAYKIANGESYDK